MSFHELNARFRRLHKEHPAWRLLRADHAPVILAFIADLFEDDNEVAFGRARAALDMELERLREQGSLDSKENAPGYLRQWIQSGWLRELDDRLSKTDACEVALRFCRQLDQRESGATASHLRIVQDAVRDLSVALSPDPGERTAILEARKAEIQRELDDLQAGIVRELSDSEQRERIVEIYQLASVLTGDFRRVEDDIRRLDQSLRIEMIESGGGRGAVILKLLEQERLLADSDAGRAFDGFFQLLCDPNRSTELREQLKTILIRPAAKHLNDTQARFLGKLMRELNKESDRVFRVRRRTEEKLRQFVESGAASEMRAVDRLLGRLERLAVGFKDAAIPLRHDTGLALASGTVKISSPASLRLKMPEEQLHTRGIEAEQNASTPSAAMLEQLHAVQVMQIAEGMRNIVRGSRIPLSVADVLERRPIEAGLEELVACLRVARAVGAAELSGRQTVSIADRQGRRFKAEIPHYLLSAEQFPERLEELQL
ncbi:DUF3375 domain-containing protein [Methylomicrobium album]|uniref:DUF3375 domain-containing protein n=1 Tax=Methylomicrobium album BG8 TaxID=686340 RepID=H8GM57_METAL|nr:DUF3375 domain-containing protein [Methylomicrobium album]EIC29418.1 Protein of unknown function (DUF3375) [Methylomicrobium album BG8]